MNDAQQAPPQPPIAVDPRLNDIITRYDSNIRQEVFTTTADKARLVLHEAVGKMELRDAWKAPLGIAVALMLGLTATTGFRDFLDVPKDSWRAIFLIVAAVSLLWLLRSLYRRQKAPTVEEIIDKMRMPTQPGGSSEDGGRTRRLSSILADWWRKLRGRA